MARTEYAEVTEGTRHFGATVTARSAGGTWHITRIGNLGQTTYLGTATRDPRQPRTHEWVLRGTADQPATYHPTLGSALSVAARTAAALLRDEVLAEEQAALAAPPAGDLTTTCPDCGATVPTIRTGEGWPDLPHCPATTSRHYLGHRVSRDALDAALRLREVQAYLATMPAAPVTRR